MNRGKTLIPLCVAALQGMQNARSSYRETLVRRVDNTTAAISEVPLCSDSRAIQSACLCLHPSDLLNLSDAHVGRHSPHGFRSNYVNAPC